MIIVSSFFIWLNYQSELNRHIKKIIPIHLVKTHTYRRFCQNKYFSLSLLSLIPFLFSYHFLYPFLSLSQIFSSLFLFCLFLPYVSALLLKNASYPSKKTLKWPLSLALLSLELILLIHSCIGWLGEWPFSCWLGWITSFMYFFACGCLFDKSLDDW